MPRTSFVCWLAVLAVMVTRTAFAESGAFVIRTPADTLAVEHWTRSVGALHGELAFRVTGLRFGYALDYDAEGAPRFMRVTVHRLADPADATPLQVADLRFAGDSVYLDKSPGGPERLKSVRFAVPYMNPSFALFQEAVRAAARQSRPDPVVPMFFLEGGATREVPFRRRGGDTLVADLAGTVVEFELGTDGGIRRARIPSQGLVVERASALLAPLTADAPPDYSAPAGAPYLSEDVRVPTPGGFALAGTFTRPPGSGRAPAVVLLTGSGPQDRDGALPMLRGYRPFFQIADTLGDLGIAVLRLDDRGVGGSGGAGGTSADFADDARAALAWLRARPDVDGSRLALLGHSEGGIVAPMVAAGDPALRGIVLLAAPAWTGRRVIEYQNRQLAQRTHPQAPARADSLTRAAMQAVDSMAVEQEWVRFFLAHDPLAVARRVKTPVHIVQGETDRQVSVEQAAQLAAAFRAGGNRDVSVRTWPNTNHLFLADPDGDPARYSSLTARQIDPVVLGDIAAWLHRRLSSR